MFNRVETSNITGEFAVGGVVGPDPGRRAVLRVLERHRRRVGGHRDDRPLVSLCLSVRPQPARDEGITDDGLLAAPKAVIQQLTVLTDRKAQR